MRLHKFRFVALWHSTEATLISYCVADWMTKIVHTIIGTFCAKNFWCRILDRHFCRTVMVALILDVVCGRRHWKYWDKVWI